MFTFYRTYVDQSNWKIAFLQDGKVTKIKNDKGALERSLSNIKFLVGYDNYKFDDKLVASILRDIDPYETLQKITKNKRFRLNLQNPVSLDLKQELWNLDFKEAQANLGHDISTDDHEQDLKFMELLFKKREDYFTSKFEVVREFRLKADSVKKTRVNMASEVLRTRKGNDRLRLNLNYDNRLKMNELPKQVTEFYKDIEQKFKNDVPFQELESEQMTYRLSGIDHIYGFGGLHAAINNYVSEGHFMQIDVKSYYPTLIMNNSLLDEKALERYRAIYKDRQKLQKLEDPKEEAYKLILNIVYGGLKSRWTNLYNPQASNNIVVNGQLMLTHLILLLENFCELIQTNTDGLIIKYEPVMKKSILKIIKLFEQQYSLSFDIKYINKIAQRDVNNYVIRYVDGSLNARGRFANYDGGDFERNSLTVIDKALVEYFINGTRVNRTIIDLWKNNKLEYFQLVKKAGKFDGMAHELKESTLLEGTYSSRFKELPNVNRIFATNDKNLGGIYNVRNGVETQYSKVPYTSDSVLVHNESLNKLNKRKINLNWYIKETERWLF